MREWIVLVSVIIPVTRDSEAGRRCVEEVLAQQGRFEIELILVGSEELDIRGERARIVRVEDLNPAVRRNQGVAASNGEIIAFIDDDAWPEPGWIENALDELRSSSSVMIVGGPDPAPPDSTSSELLTDTMLAAPLFGSGVRAHQSPPKRRIVRSPGDLALVNLFIRSATFRALGGFDEAIGYIGEDSDLIARAMEFGEVVYRPDVVVRHRRRPFPLEYMTQRFRYRFKTGRLLVQPGSLYRRNWKVVGFLLAALLCLAVVMISPTSGIALLTAYVVGALMSGLLVTRLPWYWWPVLPFAFMLHHATYLTGLLAGMARGTIDRLTRSDDAPQQQETE